MGKLVSRADLETYVSFVSLEHIATFFRLLLVGDVKSKEFSTRLPDVSKIVLEFDVLRSFFGSTEKGPLKLELS